VVILDGLIGAGGIDASLPGSDGAIGSMNAFGDRFGFQTLRNAFSQFSSTIPSVPVLLNFKQLNGQKRQGFVKTQNGISRLIRNDFFDFESARGKRVRVFQSNYLDFCRHPAVVSCTTFNGHDAFSQYMPEEVSSRKWTMAFVALKETTQDSIVLKYMMLFFYRGMKIVSEVSSSDGFFVPDNSEFNAIGFPGFFHRFSTAVSESSPLDTIFAHFIVPHAPYVLDKDCSFVKEWPGFPRNLTQHQGLYGEKLEQARIQHNRKYFLQMSCIFNKLEELMKVLEVNGELKRTEIVILGDHGSRISSGSDYEFLEYRDIVANYSTYFSANFSNSCSSNPDRYVTVQFKFGEQITGMCDSSDKAVVQQLFIPLNKSREFHAVDLESLVTH
jgi:hypothetical protein